MHCDELTIAQFRNISHAKLHFSQQFNFIYGLNGSGKTSLLEALYFANYGKSFRTSSIDRLIQKDERTFTIFARFDDASVGISKTRNSDRLVKVNGETCKNFSTFSQSRPFLVISPESLKLLTDGPEKRRQFLDWAMFHVEPLYLSDWRNFRKALKYRNLALRRDRISSPEQGVWTDYFVNSGESIDLKRTAYFNDLNLAFSKQLENSRLENLAPFKIQYFSGWDKKLGLRQSLEKVLARDTLAGSTSLGPHKADIRISCKLGEAKHYLSRGQLKVLVMQLYLAQIKTVEHLMNTEVIIAVDDLVSELDQPNNWMVYNLLSKHQGQLFITLVDNARHFQRFQQQCHVGEAKMFHVEHGKIYQEI